MKITIKTKGSKFIIDVGTQEPILQIKQKIQHFLGVPINSQTLTVLDWELIDGLDLSDYPLISDGSTMHLTTTYPQTQPPTTKIKLTIKFSARKIEIDADRVTDTVHSLKDKIHIVEGTSIKKMALYFNGKEMEDDFRSLNDYGLQEGSEIVVSLKMMVRTMDAAALTRRVGVVVQTSASLMDGVRLAVEMSDTCRVDEMAGMMVENGMLPEDEYIFIHKQRIMRGHCSLRWHGVENGDFVYVFKGSVSRGEY
ncbi:hypothetical protein OROGR_001240 [Orobanche gracilis]